MLLISKLYQDATLLLQFEKFFSVGNDGFCEVEETNEFFSNVHVFQRARIIFGGKEVIAVVKVESLADVFESVCKVSGEINSVASRVMTTKTS